MCWAQETTSTTGSPSSLLIGQPCGAPSASKACLGEKQVPAGLSLRSLWENPSYTLPVSPLEKLTPGAGMQKMPALLALPNHIRK